MWIGNTLGVVRGSTFSYNFFRYCSQNDPATFYTAHLEDMHQSLTRISYPLWRSRCGGEQWWQHTYNLKSLFSCTGKDSLLKHLDKVHKVKSDQKVYNRHNALKKKKKNPANNGIAIIDEKEGWQNTSSTWQLTCLKVHPKPYSLITPKHHSLSLSMHIGGFSAFFHTPKN